jgi:hypothetical protein
VKPTTTEKPRLTARRAQTHGKSGQDKQTLPGLIKWIMRRAHKRTPTNAQGCRVLRRAKGALQKRGSFRPLVG